MIVTKAIKIKLQSVKLFYLKKKTSQNYIGLKCKIATEREEIDDKIQAAIWYEQYNEWRQCIKLFLHKEKQWWNTLLSVSYYAASKGAPPYVLLDPVPNIAEYGGRKDIRHKSSLAKINMQIKNVQYWSCLCSTKIKLVLVRALL